jgi:Tol biopolymer transport system component
MVHEFDPSWSPDSRWILFSTFRDPASEDPDQQVQLDYEVFAVTPHGTNLTQLTANDWVDDFTPEWRPSP